MGHVIPLHGDPHEATQRLLPWYLTDTLDPAEHGLVEHHLAECPECRADLASEERLRDAMTSSPASLPDQWDSLRQRALKATATPVTYRRRSFRMTGGGLALIAASQVAIFFAGFGAYGWLHERDQAAYHALSASTAARTGNIIVIFRPDMPEQQFRSALNAAGARLADGPTAAGAYVLSVSEDRREASLNALRTRADVILAQPIDNEAVP